MPKIELIYTGGTIGGEYDGGHKVLSEDITLSEFKPLVIRALPPDLKNSVELSFSRSRVNKFSEQITPDDWRKIASSVERVIKRNVDGVVIAHGTDTLPYTAAALSFMLRGLPIPVVLTGSNIPLDGVDSDGPHNLADAVQVALDRRFRGVYVAFSGMPHQPSLIHCGTRVRKVRFVRNCYESVNVSPVGDVAVRHRWFFRRQSKISIWNTEILSHVASKLASEGDFRLERGLNAEVSCFKLFPGFDPQTIIQDIKRGKQAIIVEAYNSGTGCTEGSPYSLLPVLETAKTQHVPVFFCSQQEGSVEMDRYESAVLLQEAGVVPLRDMIMEAAVPKVMWGLAQVDGMRDRVDRERALKELMLRDICGEVSSI